MSPLEITVIAVAAALVVFTVIFNFVRRKKGKTSCGCDCAHCSCASCHRKDDGGKKPNGKAS